MNTTSDSAEQLIRLYLNGIEYALRISGSASKNIVAALYVLSKDNKKTKGKTRLANMLKSNSELRIFSIKKSDMETFAKEAKCYGVLYSALVNKSNMDFDGMIDIMVKAEDAPKVNRIVERFKLLTVDKAKIIAEEITKEMNEKKQNPLNVKAEKENPLENSSNNKTELNGNTKKKSVRKELQKYKAEELNKNNTVKDLNKSFKSKKEKSKTR